MAAESDAQTMDRMVYRYKGYQCQLRSLLVHTFPLVYKGSEFSHLTDYRLRHTEDPNLDYLAYAKHHGYLLSRIYRYREQRHNLSEDDRNHSFARATFKWLVDDSNVYIAEIVKQIGSNVKCSEYSNNELVEPNEVFITNRYAELEVEDVIINEDSYHPLKVEIEFKPESKNRRRKITKLNITDDELIAKYRDSDRPLADLSIEEATDLFNRRVKSLWGRDHLISYIFYGMVVYMTNDIPMRISKRTLASTMVEFSMINGMLRTDDSIVARLHHRVPQIRKRIRILKLDMGLLNKGIDVHIVANLTNMRLMHREYMKAFRSLPLMQYMGNVVSFAKYVTLDNKRTMIYGQSYKDYFLERIEMLKLLSGEFKYQTLCGQTALILELSVADDMNGPSIDFEMNIEDLSECSMCTQISGIPKFHFDLKLICIRCLYIPDDMYKYPAYSMASMAINLKHAIKLITFIDHCNEPSVYTTEKDLRNLNPLVNKFLQVLENDEIVHTKERINQNAKYRYPSSYISHCDSLLMEFNDDITIPLARRYVNYCERGDNYMAYHQNAMQEGCSTSNYSFNWISTNIRPLNFIPTYQDWCLGCDKTNVKFRCSKCRTVKFCSVSCQRKCWPIHKKHCGRDLFTHCIVCGSDKVTLTCDKCPIRYCGTICRSMFHIHHRKEDCLSLTQIFSTLII
jgi:MYND finger protein